MGYSLAVFNYYAQVFPWLTLLVVVVIVDVSPQLVVVGLLVGLGVEQGVALGAESGWQPDFAPCLHWLLEEAVDLELPSASAPRQSQIRRRETNVHYMSQ